MTKKKETVTPKVEGAENPGNQSQSQAAANTANAPIEKPGSNDGEDGPIAPPPPAGPMDGPVGTNGLPLGSIDWKQLGVEALDNGNILIKGHEFTPEDAQLLANPIYVKDGIIEMAPDVWDSFVEKYAIKPGVLVIEDHENMVFSVGSQPYSETEFENIKALGLVVDGKFAGDPNGFKPEEYIFVTENDLKEFKQLGEAGVVAGDTRKIALAKIEAKKSAETEEKGENVAGSGAPAVNETSKDLPPTPPVETKEEKPKGKGKGKKVVYHGDFLTESQMAVEDKEITFDWDEVTAESHLAIKPKDL